MRDLRRVLPISIALTALVLVAACGGSADRSASGVDDGGGDDRAASSPDTTGTPTPTSSATPAPTATPTAATEPTPLSPGGTTAGDGLPDALGAADFEAAYAAVLDWPGVLVSAETITAIRRADGTEAIAEGVAVEQIWDGDRVSGHASFAGESTIRRARAAGNDALADIMLSSGVDFAADGDVVFIPRAVGAALGVDISDSGTPWVAIDGSALDETELFALGLIAPVTLGRLEVSNDSDDFLAERVGVVDGFVLYGSEDDETDSSITVALDGDGAIRGFSSRSPFPIEGAVSRLQILYEPYSDEPPAAVASEDWEDVTAAFRDYVATRLSGAPATLGN